MCSVLLVEVLFVISKLCLLKSIPSIPQANSPAHPS